MNHTEHLLTCLGEEGCEVAQCCSKALRFGLDDRNVLNPSGPTNRERLVEEINDFLGVCSLLVDHGILPKDWLDFKAQDRKKAKVVQFMQYAKEVGALKIEEGE